MVDRKWTALPWLHSCVFLFSFADGISWVEWPAASSSQLLKFWVQGRLWLGKLEGACWEHSEGTALDVGSQLCGAKSTKVIVLLKLLTWIITFNKKMSMYLLEQGWWSLACPRVGVKCADVRILSDIRPTMGAAGEQNAVEDNELLLITWVFWGSFVHLLSM